MRTLLAVIAAVLITACSGSASPAGNQTAGKQKATIDLTVTGALEGTSTHLAKTDCNAPAFGTFYTTITPVINGGDYDIYLAVAFKSGPETIDIATAGDKVQLTIHKDEIGWQKTNETTGSVTINADGQSGSVDAHRMRALGLQTFIDLKFTFFCPAAS